MRKILLICTIVLMAQQTKACEFCGCSSGNYFIGPFPQFKNYFAGTRYTFRSFTTTLSSDPTQFSRDFYQTIEIWGGVNIGKRWQVLGFLPYNMNRQESDDGIIQTNGLGDATVIGNYRLINIQGQGRTGHQFWMGAGVKLPTGHYAPDPEEINPSANNQPGSGSVDYVLNAMYSIEFINWHMNATTTYRINREASGFQFGNRIAASLFAYRPMATLFATFNPTVGLMYEDLSQNKVDKVPVESTGGHSVLGALGMDTNLGRVTIGFNVQLPLYQHYSDGQTSTKIRGMVHVAYSF